MTSFQLSTAPYAYVRGFVSRESERQRRQDGKLGSVRSGARRVVVGASKARKEGRKKLRWCVASTAGWSAAWLDTVIIFYQKTSLTSDLALDDSRLKAVFKLSQGKTALTDL